MIKYFERRVKELDPNLSMTDDAAYAAAMLICAAKYGARDDETIRRTGVPEDKGKVIAKRFRSNKVWVGTTTHHAGWDDEESGAIAFWMDAGVGCGLLERAKPKKKARPRMLTAVDAAVRELLG